MTRKDAVKPNVLEVHVAEGQTNAEAVAAKVLGPVNRHGMLAGLYGGAIVSGLPEKDRPEFVEYSRAFRHRVRQARTGDLNGANDLLMAQALTLDGIFTETARRAATNMQAGYLQPFEIYMRLALKAQAQSRATLEALARLHQPREQTVRHVHVNEGGQAIVADEFHQHIGGSGNAKAAEQSREPSSAAKGGAALPGPQSSGEAVSVPRARRKETVPAPRRPGRSANGKP